MARNLAPNNEEWRWVTGKEPDMAGEALKDANTIAFTAADDIKKYDVVAIYESGGTWNYPNTTPKVATVGSEVPAATALGLLLHQTIGVALKDADSGEVVTVKIRGLVSCKTNAVVTAGKWVRGARWVAGEKMGCVYMTDNTGDTILGMALNTTAAPVTAGTGTTTSKFQYEPVIVQLVLHGDPLNRGPT